MQSSNNNYQVRDIEIRKASEMQSKLKENMKEVKEALKKPILPKEASIEDTSVKAETKLKEVIEKKTQKFFKSIDELRANLESSKDWDVQRFNMDCYAEQHKTNTDTYSLSDSIASTPLPVKIPTNYAKYILLNCIDKQREIRPANVRKLTKDMKEGKFDVNNHSIAFDKTGSLIDGQHRLLASVNAEKDLETLVVYNLPCESYTTIDRGASRNIKDDMEVEVGLSESLDLKGKPNSNARVAKVIAWLKAIVACRKRSLIKGSIGAGWVRPSQEVTNCIQLDVLDNESYLKAIKWYEQFTFQLQGNHPELKKTNTGRPCQFGRYQGVAAALIYYRVAQPEFAYDFTSKLYGGCEIVKDKDGNLITKTLRKDDPIMRLRNKLLAWRGNGAEAQDTLYYLTKNAAHKHFGGQNIKSFNKFRSGTIFYEDWKIPCEEESELELSADSVELTA